MTRGIYAGTFDCLTNGHLDIIKRSFSFCNELMIGVGVNPNKKTMFSEFERIAMIEQSLETIGFEWKAQPFSGLLVDFAKQIGATILIRGIRSVSDFEYEINLANINKNLSPNIETVFLPTSPELATISSSMVKEIARYNGDISRFVPPHVEDAVKKKFIFNK